MIYGEAGIGKSTFAAQFPAPIFITTEEGINEIDVDHCPMVRSYQELRETFNFLNKVLTEQKGKYKTLVIDSIDALEKLVWGGLIEAAKSPKIQSIEDFPYGSGYREAVTAIKTLTDQIDKIFRMVHKLHVVMIAHAVIEQSRDPESEAYSRYAPSMHAKFTAVIQQWADEIFFIRSQVSEVKSAGYEARRILYTTSQPTHMAKNRLNLRNYYEFTRTCFQDNFTTFYQ
jgi:hypothetical protein